MLSLGVGIDYEWSYIAAANRLKRGAPLYFLIADATRVPLRSRFDAAVCLTNTWGTMHDQLAVLGEMRRLAPASGTRWITVYAPGSVEARRQWYANLGQEVVEVSEERIVTSGLRVASKPEVHFTGAWPLFLQPESSRRGWRRGGAPAIRGRPTQRR